jgi:hypothetical protein
MRRRLERFIPIVLLAVLVQLLAPIAALRVVAYASSDPLYLTSICSSQTSSSDQQTPSNTQHSHLDCCAFCPSSHAGGAAFDAPQPIFATLQRQFLKIVWLEAVRPVLTIRVGSNAQARAPPSFS